MSRKKQVYEKITALYCRISLDDGGDNESMSISNQKIMLRDFAEKHGMFQYEYYVDDGYTGRNFNRPSFQRMIADIEAGKIGCVITKDPVSYTHLDVYKRQQYAGRQRDLCTGQVPTFDPAGAAVQRRTACSCKGVRKRAWLSGYPDRRKNCLK